MRYFTKAYWVNELGPRPGKIAGHIALWLGIIIAFFVLNPFVIIGAGHRGVVLNFGKVEDNVLGEGLHIRTPFVQKILKLDVRTVKHEVQALAYSKDIQTVDATVALNYHLQPDTVNKLVQEIGQDYEVRVIDPSIQESVKAATAKFTAQELIEQRPKVKDEIRTLLTERLQNRHIVVDDFSIVNFDFSDAYETAVEAKQVAQQDALKAENKLKQVQVEAEQRIAQAKAEAEAIRIQAESISKQGGAEYVNLKAIEKWSGTLPQYMLPNATLPFIQIPNAK